MKKGKKLSKSKQIAKDLFEKTGVDFEKYRSKDIIEAVADIALNITPKGLIQLSFFPVLIISVSSFSFLLICFIFIDLTFFGYVFLFIITLIGGILLCISKSILNIIVNLVSNIEKIILLSMELVITILKDIEELIKIEINISNNSVIKDKKEAVQSKIKIPNPIDLLRGVILVTILPALSKVLEKKLKFLAKPFVWILDIVIANIVDLLTKFIEKTGDKITSKVKNSSLATSINAKKENLVDKVKESKIGGALKAGNDKISKGQDFTSEKLLIVGEKVDNMKDIINKYLFKMIIPKMLLPFKLVFYIIIIILIILNIAIISIFNDYNEQTDLIEEIK